MLARSFIQYILLILIICSPFAAAVTNDKPEDARSQKNIIEESYGSHYLLFNDSLDLYILKLILIDKLEAEHINQSYGNTFLTQDKSYTNSKNKIDYRLSYIKSQEFNFEKFQENNEPNEHNPIYNISVSFLRGVFAGTGEAFRIKEQYSKNKEDKAGRDHFGRLWHDYAILRDAATIGVGITIAEYSKLEFWKIIQGIFTAAAVNFITFQSSYNLTLGQPIFKQSTTTTSRIESAASFPVMGALLLSALALEFIF